MIPVLTLRPGRQLFIDDFLIEESTLKQTWHPAKLFPENPVLIPETELEFDSGKCPAAAPFNDGVWYDPADRLYKLYYHAGWFQGTALAVSRDGLRFERPRLDAAGSNLVLPLRPGFMRDGSTVWLDQAASDSAERYKMFLFNRAADAEIPELYTSPDGIRWRYRCATPPVGDNTGFYYDPFLKRWVFSVRSFVGGVRARTVFLRENFIDEPWEKEAESFFLSCDSCESLDPEMRFPPQLYDFNAVPYESLMLGSFGIFLGYENDVCTALGIPKAIDLGWGFCREGLRFDRPPKRECYLRSSRQPGSYNRGYLHNAGGITLVYRDKLRIFFGAWSGDSVLKPGELGGHFASCAMYAGGSTGVAELRRDGFASMNGSGELLTGVIGNPAGELYVNFKGESLRARLENPDGSVIEGYSFEESATVGGDSVKTRLCWATACRVPDSPFRIRFRQETGELYAFWLSTLPGGASGGYLAAGSEDYRFERDI